ncbi:MAG: hypothetical protein RR382_01335 [Tannerellaceae bacterium]
MSSRPATGKRDVYYRLVESYRNLDDRVCHRTILNVGFINHYSLTEYGRDTLELV